METKIIKNGIVLTNDKDFRIIKDGALAIEGNRIVDVNVSDEVLSAYSPDEVIDARGKMVVPGFCKRAHAH